MPLIQSKQTHSWPGWMDSEWILKLIVKLRQGSGKDGQGMALKAKGLKAQTLA